jgi:hypothetical protein
VCPEQQSKKMNLQEMKTTKRLSDSIEEVIDSINLITVGSPSVILEQQQQQQQQQPQPQGKRRSDPRDQDEDEDEIEAEPDESSAAECSTKDCPINGTVAPHSQHQPPPVDGSPFQEALCESESEGKRIPGGGVSEEGIGSVSVV